MTLWKINSLNYAKKQNLKGVINFKKDLMVRQRSKVLEGIDLEFNLSYLELICQHSINIQGITDDGIKLFALTQHPISC